MKNFIMYVGGALLIAWLLKLIVRWLSAAVGFIFMAALGFREQKINFFVEKHPKVFFLYCILLRSTVGAIYGAAIGFLTRLVLATNPGDVAPWAYILLSFLWVITILKGANVHHVTLLASYMGGLTLVYLGLGILGPVISWVAVSLASGFYYLGRIDMLRQTMIENGEYMELFNQFKK